MTISETRQQGEFVLTITKDGIESTDGRFTMDNLELGNGYEPLDVYFEKASGEQRRRNREPGEQEISNSTMPRLAFQEFEKDIAKLSDEEKANFPVCRFHPDSKMFKGIYTSVKDFHDLCDRGEATFVKYTRKIENGLFVIYCISIFSTVIFVQECLKRFGEEGDRFILTYREKRGKDTKAAETEADAEGGTDQQISYLNKYSPMLIASKNLIFRGAPGTGKTYLARQIAADIVSDGKHDDPDDLTEEQKKRIGFVQFHPSYDYTDFVEGLRPKANPDGTLGFELKDGVFKGFAARARKSLEDSNESAGAPKYVFIIDEINRGEISKIFGELFFSVDPGYRGKKGEISTQYSNLHEDPDEKFYIPENVYIIGTMNDIDRSVDSFDFAMRRRFRFVELKADGQTGMLDQLGKEKKEEAIRRMKKLNKAISDIEGLDENYHIGAAYFLKLKDIGFEALWEDHLEPLLREYVRGMPDEKDRMNGLYKAYQNSEPDQGDADGTAPD